MALNFLNNGYFAGKVGIGTDSPVGILEVAGNTDTDANFLIIKDKDASAGSARPSIRFAKSDSTVLGQLLALDGTNQRLQFSGNNTQDPHLTVYNDGNVGIGITTPGYKLEISDDTAPTLTLRNPSANPANAGMIRFIEATNTDGFQLTFNGSDNKLKFISDSSGTEVTRMVIQRADGHVGIGATAPEGILQISKPSSTVYDGTSDTGQSNIGASVTIQNTNTTVNSFAQINMQVSASSNRAVGRIVTIARGNASSDMAFVTESFGVRAEKMRIDQTGHVGIGTTSPSYRLTAYGSSTDSEIVASFGSANDVNEYTAIGLSGFIASNGATKAGLALKRTSTYGTGELHFLNNNTTDNSDMTLSDSKMMINASGNVGIGTTSPSNKLVISGNDTNSDLNGTTVTDAALQLSNSDEAYGTFFGTLSSGTGLIQQRRRTSAVYYN